MKMVVQIAAGVALGVALGGAVLFWFIETYNHDSTDVMYLLPVALVIAAISVGFIYNAKFRD